jgi:hypothetical protein
MTIGEEDRQALAELDSRLRIVLPEEYQDSYETVQPVSMGSAGLKYASDGQVAWDEIWDTFCDLAMAGGPPHKGTLLEPGTGDAIAARADRYRAVVDEICRGVTLVTDLPAAESPVPGWVRVDCYSEVMAGWLLRAIVMENVAVRAQGRALDLPASPDFRVEKEIKNVITVIAKTCHYYLGHMPRSQQRAIASLFATLATTTPLLRPGEGDAGAGGRESSLRSQIGERVLRETGMATSTLRYAGWLGVECPGVSAAVWLMRAMVASNVLARRENTILFVPIDAATDPDGTRVSTTLARIHRLAAVRGVI